MPMRPSPTMPSVLPRSSVPCSDFFSHLPARVVESARQRCRASASISAMVCSATATAFAPGVFITAMPALVAASRSILSTPTPARPITRNFCALRSTCAFTSTADRTISASASFSAASSPSVSWSCVSTVQSASSFRSCTALAATFSAITIFIVVASLQTATAFRQIYLLRTDAQPSASRRLYLAATAGCVVSAYTCCAAFNPAPNSIGMPISASTCSSAPIAAMVSR